MRRGAASSRSWVTYSTVLPSSFRRSEQLEHVGRGVRVEVAGRLVADDQLRVGGERARDRDALLLAAGELRRQVVGLVAEADQVEVAAGDARSARACEPRRAKSSGSTAFSSAVSVGSSWKNWNTIPTLRATPDRELLLAQVVRARRPSTVTAAGRGPVDAR